MTINDYNDIMTLCIFGINTILNFSCRSCFPPEIQKDAWKTFLGGKNWFLGGEMDYYAHSGDSLDPHSDLSDLGE